MRRIIAFSILAVALFLGGGFVLAESMLRAVIHFKFGVPGKSYGLWRHDDVRHVPQRVVFG